MEEGSNNEEVIVSSSDVSNEESQPQQSQEESVSSVDNSEDKAVEAVSNDEAAKIRHSTEHKVTKKYESRVKDLEDQIANLSNPPDEESTYDSVLGEWCAPNMTRKEYSEKVSQKIESERFRQKQEADYAPRVARAEKVISSIKDFKPIVDNAVNSGVLSQQLVLEASKDDGSLETIYDLVKTGSQKLLEIQRLPNPEDQRLALAKLTWLKNNSSSPKTNSSADSPLSIVSGTNGDNSEGGEFSNGYKQYIKERKGNI